MKALYQLAVAFVAMSLGMVLQAAQGPAPAAGGDEVRVEGAAVGPLPTPQRLRRQRPMPRTAR